jgi:putative addiction module component (TIGR02574 family)
VSAAEIIEKIRPLPTEQKRELLEQIWAEFGKELGWVDAELTPDQIAELDRRLARFEKDPSSGIPLEQVEEEMRQRFGWK